MKTRFLKTSSCIILLTVLGLTSYAFRSERAIAQGDSPGGKLEGTWRADVTLTNCAGTPIRTFQSLITFVPAGTPGVTGGSVLESSNSSFFRSASHGIWRYEGGQTFSAKFRHFLFDSSGVVIRTNDVTKTIVLGPGDNEYAATTAFEMRDLSGNLVQAGCATDVARRVE
ncbi:MAG TPA: hypothetical protein VFU37_20025 [Pyrinomonadaceae bacterium]|nr:hypothetical protein [Pyrinomonadaceae bacterium]